MKEEFRILSTTAILGYGFPMASFEEGMKRPIPSGNLGETDVYGAQQHGPLLDLEFDL